MNHKEDAMEEVDGHEWVNDSSGRLIVIFG